MCLKVENGHVGASVVPAGRRGYLLDYNMNLDTRCSKSVVDKDCQTSYLAEINNKKQEIIGPLSTLDEVL